MDIRISRHNGWQVFLVSDDLGIRSDVTALRNDVMRQIENGGRHIAIIFSPDSFLNTDAISMCIHCAESMRDAGGELAFINPGKQITDVFAVTDLASLVTIYSSVENLPVR